MTTSWENHGKDPETLLRLLGETYWAAVEQEIRPMILALAEYMHVCPEPTEVEIIPPQPNRDRQNKFAKAWSNIELDDKQLEHIRHVFKNWTTEDHSKPLVQRRAKELLQSAGWLDIDFVHSDRLAEYPSMQGIPKVREIDRHKVFQAIQCSTCRKCIRTHYFQCTEGCIDKESTKSHFKCRPLPKKSPDDISHLIPRMQATAYRLCISCMAIRATSTSNPKCQNELNNIPAPAQSHLKMTNLIEPHIGPEAAKFAAELDALEDMKEGGSASVKALVGLTLTRVTPNGVRRVFPAGNMHLAFRFGPVMIENGVPHSQGGILISSREPQNLLYNAPPSFCQVTVPNKNLALSPSLEIFSRSAPEMKRRTLAVMKQVVGGLFTNYSVWDEAENATTLLLAEAATAYNALSPMTRLSSRRTFLHTSASGILSTLRPAISTIVSLHLSWLIVFLTAKTTKLAWHPILNNCQAFCNSLLSSQDWTSVQWSLSPNTMCYLHSFASPSAFPLFPSNEENGKAAANLDLGAYMSSLHNASDLISFAHGRKLSMLRNREGVSDIIFFKTEHYNCKHRESLFDNIKKRENPMLYLSDHVLDDPFSAMALLASHLERKRELNVDTEGRALREGEEGRKEWVRNRICVVVAQDVFFGMGKAIFVCGKLFEGEIQKGERVGVRKESRSAVEGRARWKEEGDVVDLGQWWEIHPMEVQKGTVRGRVGGLVRRIVKGKEEEIAWEKCNCRYCSMSDEELAKARGLGESAE